MVRQFRPVPTIVDSGELPHASAALLEGRRAPAAHSSVVNCCVHVHCCVLLQQTIAGTTGRLSVHAQQQRRTLQP